MGFALSFPHRTLCAEAAWAPGPTTSGGNVRPSGQGAYVAEVSLVRGPAGQSVPALEGDGSATESRSSRGHTGQRSSLLVGGVRQASPMGIVRMWHQTHRLWGITEASRLRPLTSSQV